MRLLKMPYWSHLESLSDGCADLRVHISYINYTPSDFYEINTLKLAPPSIAWSVF